MVAIAEVDPTADLTTEVTTCGEVGWMPLRQLIGRWQLELQTVDDDAAIPGSYWGAPEAGLIGTTVYARRDTPIHSLLHEGCHLLCADVERRATVDGEVGGDDAEENAVCYLQILLADQLKAVGRDRLMADMDAWGYSFRLGSTRAWFEQDAADARQWLYAEGLIDDHQQPTWRARGGNR